MASVDLTLVRGREILNSRGTPTVEITLETGGMHVRASVPEGASKGSHEAIDARDGGVRYGGKGVREALARSLGEINAMILGKQFDQASLDAALCALDGTPEKSRIGANVILGVSLAFARASATQTAVPLWRHLATLAGASPRLPQPALNVINGGAHASNGLPLQEFMLLPQGGTLDEQLAAAATVIASLKARLTEAGLGTAVGDEGGFAPRLSRSEKVLELLRAAADDAGLRGVLLALDAAAGHFFVEGQYIFSEEREQRSALELSAWYESLVDQFGIVSIEDPFNEDDFASFAALRARLGGRAQIVGDDLTVTNSTRIERASKAGALDAVVIKPNQIGTVSEAITAARTARMRGLRLFVSHRSGETIDTFIADLAVGLSAEYCKFGSLARGERVEKYNRLLEIAEELSA